MYIVNEKYNNFFINIFDNYNLMYHFDITKFKNINNNFSNIFIYNYYKKNFNINIFSKYIYIKKKFYSSTWILREYLDMFGSINNNKLLDNRKLLINYSTKRGVLIYW